MRKKPNISMQESTLEITDKRAKSLNLTRSSYITGLILKDIFEALEKLQEKEDKEKKALEEIKENLRINEIGRTDGPQKND